LGDDLKFQDFAFFIQQADPAAHSQADDLLAEGVVNLLLAVNRALQLGGSGV
jgi:hypothetical protein